MNELSFKKFLYLQVNFNQELCDDIFGNISKHLFSKWLYYDNNLIIFINSLDRDNKKILFEWLNQNDNKIC